MIAEKYIPEMYDVMRRYLSPGDVHTLTLDFIGTKLYVKNKSFRDTIEALRSHAKKHVHDD